MTSHVISHTYLHCPYALPRPLHARQDRASHALFDFCTTYSGFTLLFADAEDRRPASRRRRRRRVLQVGEARRAAPLLRHARSRAAARACFARLSAPVRLGRRRRHGQRRCGRDRLELAHERRDVLAQDDIDGGEYLLVDLLELSKVAARLVRRKRVAEAVDCGRARGRGNERSTSGERWVERR